MASLAQLHAELIRFLRQHCPARDRRHLVLLGWMVAGLLLSETVCFDRWKSRLPLAHCLAASWQRRCQHWPKPDQALHLATGTTMLWNRFCLVVLSVVCHGRAIPVLWQTLEHPSVSVSAEVVIARLQRADPLLAGFGSITVLADRAFPSAELLRWFEGQSRWQSVMRLRADTEVHGAGAPLGCQVRRLRLQRGECRGLRDGRLWADGSQPVNLVLAHPTGLPVEEPCYLVSKAEPSLDLVWAYGQRFCCEQLFRDQKSGVFQLAGSRLSCPDWIDRLLLVVAIAVLIGSLQG